MNLHAKTSLLLAFLLLSATMAIAGELRVFGPDSMRAIEQDYESSSFIVGVWATDCPPCRRELALLSAFSVKHPGVPVVLIATDPSDNAQAVAEVLDTFVLPGAGLWRFGNAGEERLRYAIDPEWHGELPRSYLYDANGDRVGISGPMSDGLLQRWLSNCEGGAQF